MSKKLTAATKTAGFPANFRMLRTSYGESQQAVAVALEIAVATVSRWERGESEPNMPMLRKIAEHYKTTMSELVMGE